MEKWYDWCNGSLFKPTIECLVCRREIKTSDASQSSGPKNTVQCHNCHVILGRTKEVPWSQVHPDAPMPKWQVTLFSPDEEVCRVFGLDPYFETKSLLGETRKETETALQKQQMDTGLKAHIMASTFTAVMVLAKESVALKPADMSQADFERSIAAEIAKQATSLVNLDDVSLKIIRDTLAK